MELQLLQQNLLKVIVVTLKASYICSWLFLCLYKLKVIQVSKKQMNNKSDNVDSKSNEASIEEQQKKILEIYRCSLKLADVRNSYLQSEITEQRAFIGRIQVPAPRASFLNKKFRDTFNGRLIKKYPLKITIRRLIEVYKKDGFLGVGDKISHHLPFLNSVIKRKLLIEETSNVVIHEGSKKNAPAINKLDIIYHYQFPKVVVNTDSSLILIVAEVTLPQCYKYRVQQKAEHFQRLGWNVKIVDWRDQKDVLSGLQVCKEVIFYRVPAFDNVVEQITEAKRLGLSPWWEVDDLIIDEERYAECGFMQYLSKEEKDLLFFGTNLYRKTMFSFDRAIASTKALAEVMYKAGTPNVCVIENALDKDTLRIAHKINKDKNTSLAKTTHTALGKKDNEVVIIYGSGTNTHNADFLVASKGIFSALQKESTLRLWVIGELEIPSGFKSITNQVRYIPPLPYEQYLEFLSLADIAIAPLEPILFNDAKSNIKYLEASILKVASVCSPRQAFREVIRDQENGMLANTSDEWESKIILLARDAKLRQSMGEKAYQDVIAHYSPENITIQQVEPIFGKPKVTSVISKTLKVLVVNVYYDPYSFGGATFVAEAMAKAVHKEKDVEVTVFTSRPVNGAQRGLCKYKRQGSTVYSLDLSPIVHDTQKIDNFEIVEAFELILNAEKPDVVHFHSIQNMGLQMLLTCQSRHIPYIITLHDAWWLCNRQFMVRSNGEYCFQNKIDLKVCQPCEAHAQYLTERMIMMKQGLQAASLLLSPSETHRQLYIANDIDEQLIKVNRNGISRPKKKRPSRSKNTPIRFGFVAGDELIKGASLIQKVFKSLVRSDWELRIIDSKVDMGYPPIDVKSWKAKGKITTLLPYDDDGKDDFFYGIDVLLFPSQWKESYGMTVREALLRDVWVICSHPGGQSEDVVDGVNGNYISLTGDQAELTKVIEELLDNASMFDRYENPHKDHIATLDEQADELLGYYRQIQRDSQGDNLVE